MKLKAGCGADYKNWEKKVKNTKGNEVLATVLEIGNLLDSDSSIEKIVKEVAERLAIKSQFAHLISSGDVGYVATAISKFHQKGDEFRLYWNIFWTNKEKASELEINKRVTSPYERDE